nr:beta-propeller fold lactonase family protein [Vibrio lentus]
MKKSKLNIAFMKSGFAILLSLSLIACDDDDNDNDNDMRGAIYVATNSISNNELAAYHRNNNGELYYIDNFATNGDGANFTGAPSVENIDPLASSYSVLKSEDNRFIYAVNAGTNNISVFGINENHSLELLEIVPTLGSVPVTIATNGNYLYVGEQNGNNSEATISIYKIEEDGTLEPAFKADIEALPRINAMQIHPNHNDTLVMVSAVSNEIKTFKIEDGGALKKADTFTYSKVEEGRNEANPFGVTLLEEEDGKLLAVVSEARAGGENLQTGSVSLFEIKEDLTISDIQLDCCMCNFSCVYLDCLPHTLCGGYKTRKY